jgi:hypothetical protein
MFAAESQALRWFWLLQQIILLAEIYGYLPLLPVLGLHNCGK